jgi:hypothetical protein
VAKPWIKRKTRGGPSSHALVIGVSAYEHLPNADAPPDLLADETFGLRQLQSAAASAWSFAEWLRDEYNPPSAPLATVRLLLSPSAEEETKVKGLKARGAGVPPATTKNVNDAVFEWREEFEDRPDDVAILYAAGHGIMLTKDEGAFVLLQDFGAPRRGMLENSLDVPRVIAGLAGQTIAQKQFFFIDACQVRPDVVGDISAMKRGVGFDVPAEHPPGLAAIYTSAAPGTLALGAPGKGTLFSQALLECLGGLAATLADDGSDWVIKDTSMVGPLQDRIAELAAEHDADQRAKLGGTLGASVLHVLPKPPPLDVEFRVAPDAAAPFCFATLDDEHGKTVLNRSPFAPALQQTVPAGLYTVAVAIDPADAGPYKARQQPCFLRPPKPPPVVVKVS